MYNRYNQLGPNNPWSNLQQLQATTPIGISANTGNLRMPHNFQYVEADPPHQYRTVTIGQSTRAENSPDYQTIAAILQPGWPRSPVSTLTVGDPQNPSLRISFDTPSPHVPGATLQVQLYTRNGAAAHCMVRDTHINQPIAESTFQAQPPAYAAMPPMQVHPLYASASRYGSAQFLNNPPRTTSDNTQAIRHNRGHVRQKSAPYPEQRPGKTNSQPQSLRQEMCSVATNSATPSAQTQLSNALVSANSASPTVAPGSATSALPAPRLKPGIAEFLLSNPETTALQLYQILADPLPSLPPQPTVEQTKKYRSLERSRKNYEITLSNLDKKLSGQTPDFTFARLLTDPATDPFIAFSQQKPPYSNKTNERSHLNTLRDLIFDLPAAIYMKSLCGSDPAMSPEKKKADQTNAGNFDEFLAGLQPPVLFPSLLDKDKGHEFVRLQRDLANHLEEESGSKGANSGLKSTAMALRRAVHPHPLEANFDAWLVSDPELKQYAAQTTKPWKTTISKIAGYMIQHGLPKDTFTNQGLSSSDEKGMRESIDDYSLSSVLTYLKKKRGTPSVEQPSAHVPVFDPQEDADILQQRLAAASTQIVTSTSTSGARQVRTRPVRPRNYVAPIPIWHGPAMPPNVDPTERHTRSTPIGNGNTRIEAVVGHNIVTWIVTPQGTPLEAWGSLKGYFTNADRTEEEMDMQELVGRTGLLDDDGGHLVAYKFMLDQGLKNLFPQNANFNKSAFKKLENDYRRYTVAGYTVNFRHRLDHFNVNRPQTVEVAFSVTDNRGQIMYSFNKVFRNQAGETYNRST